ncbi:MAG: bifunctional DNA primase/polymerase [Phycisphaerae bacterium]|nr:bifunctional DNA primase/polymerase [Phycisphaerae bacterium]
MDSAHAMLQAALWYADLGYAVFPCAPGRKQPATEHGLLDATTDQEQIERWWSESPTANVAIRTDGLLVVDIDGADNPWLADEPGKLRELACAPTSLTPRGGRQHLFRQPPGKRWRNTAGQLAPHVDTRADGGYILVAPSVVDGKCYRWLEDQGLDVPPEKLPEPPGWLVQMLEALPAANGAVVVCDAPDANAIPEGQRNDTLARLAGAMRRVGMSRTEIFAALLRVNVERCHPPLDQREVERIAASIARYAPDNVCVALVEDHFTQDFTPRPSRRQTIGELLAENLTLPAPVIHGLLRRGETMNVIAPPKTGKSWLVLGLAMSIAAGRPWLGMYGTEVGRVLILDNELRRAIIAHRVPQVAAALGVGIDEIRERVEVESLRGQLRDIRAMAPYFAEIKPGHFATVILDAMYKFLPAGTDENDNGAMAEVYNHIDAYAEYLDCAFIVVHHTTKGNQSAKSVTDVGAGAGSQARAADTHLIMRAHEQPRAVVLEAAARSWPPVEPIVLRWEFPVWRPAPDLDPRALRNEKPRRAARPPADVEDEQPSGPALTWDAEMFAHSFVTNESRTRAQIVAAASAAGLSNWKAEQLLRQAEAAGLVFRWRPKNPSCPVGFASVPPSVQEVET